MIFQTGVTSQSVDVRIYDDSGLPVTGLVAASFPALTWSRAGANADVAFPALSDLALITTAWAAGGLKERGGGVYRLDCPDAIFAAAGNVQIRGEETDKRVIVPIIEVGVMPVVYVTPVSSTVSAGEVSEWGMVLAYQFGPFGPFTIAITVGDDPLDLSGKTLLLICENTDDATDVFELGTATGELTITGADNSNVIVSDDDTHTQSTGTYHCNLRDVTADLNKVIAIGYVNVVRLPVDASAGAA